MSNLDHHPVWRVEPSSTLKSIVKDYIKKILTFIAFCKLLWGDVKVEIFLILYRFLVIFWIRLPPTHSFTPSFFGTWKVFRRYISGRRFIYVSFVAPKFLNFKWFCSSRKYHFRLPLDGFLAITPLKCSQILLKFWPVMQRKIMHDIYLLWFLLYY